VSFFDDDAEVTQVTAPTPRPRRKRNRSRLRIQRLVIALVALFVLVFVLALVIRSCQQNAKESSYRTYFTQVGGVLSDSTNSVGKPIAALLADPTKYGRTQLVAELNSLVAKQNEITARTEKISPPGKLKSLHSILIQGEEVRQAGVVQVREGLMAALGGKHLHATARMLAALSGYFTGPDAYYEQLYRTQAQKILKDDGVSNVAVPALVPAAGYFATSTVFSPSALSAALSSVSSSVKLTGAHGVGLAGVAIKSSGKTVVLSPSGSNNFKASVGLVVAVTVQNQGSATEANVPVKITWTGPGNTTPQTYSATIPSIAAHASKTVDVPGLNIPSNDMAKRTTLKVKAGPVPGEKLLSNNSASYVIIPVLA
jgi:hypothetical protein